MTLTLHLSPEIEAGLAALAEARGLAVPDLVQRLLEERLQTQTSLLSTQDRAAAWRASVEGLPLRPLLPDAAIARENLYDPRG